MSGGKGRCPAARSYHWRAWTSSRATPSPRWHQRHGVLASATPGRRPGETSAEPGRRRAARLRRRNRCGRGRTGPPRPPWNGAPASPCSAARRYKRITLGGVAGRSLAVAVEAGKRKKKRKKKKKNTRGVRPVASLRSAASAVPAHRLGVVGRDRLGRRNRAVRGSAWPGCSPGRRRVDTSRWRRSDPAAGRDHPRRRSPARTGRRRQPASARWRISAASRWTPERGPAPLCAASATPRLAATISAKRRAACVGPPAPPLPKQRQRRQPGR